MINKTNQCFVLISWEVFLLPSSNIGEEGKEGYISSEEVSFIDLGDYSD